MKILLQNIIFPDIKINVNPGVYERISRGNKLDISLGMDSHSQLADKEKNLYQVQLMINIKNKLEDLFIDLSCIGLFIIEDIKDDEQLDFVLNVNCNSIMYPYAREKVTYLTQSAGLSPLMLDSYNFIQRYNEIKKSK